MIRFSKVKMVSKDYKLPLTGLFLLLVVFLSLLNSDAYSGSNEWTKSSNNIPVGSKPNSIAYGLGNIYVTNSGSNTISVIDGKTNKVVATIPVGTSPHGVVALDSPVGGFSTIYVTNSGSNTISVIDGKTNKVVATIPVGTSPHDIIGSMLGKLYVTNSGSDNVSVIDGKTNKVVATIPVGTSPHRVALCRSKTYVTNSGSDNVSVIDGKTNKVVATIPVSHFPRGIAVADNGFIYTDR